MPAEVKRDRFKREGPADAAADASSLHLASKQRCEVDGHACVQRLHRRAAQAAIRFIQALLGHADLSTTEVYTQVSIGKLKAVHTATHPARLQPRQDANADAPHPDPQPTADALLQALAAVQP